jgi:hypothetical protein
MVAGKFWGGMFLKQFRWILILFLLGTVICAAAIPAVDNPDTAFDESDSPANLALPAPLSAKLVMPVANPVPLPQPLPQVSNISVSIHAPQPVAKQQGTQSLLTLLCTFLI